MLKVIHVDPARVMQNHHESSRVRRQRLWAMKGRGNRFGYLGLEVLGFELLRYSMRRVCGYVISSLSRYSALIFASARMGFKSYTMLCACTTYSDIYLLECVVHNFSTVEVY